MECHWEFDDALEEYIIEAEVARTGLAPDVVRAVPKQILGVSEIRPQIGAAADEGRPVIDVANILLFGGPSPSSDPNLHQAVVTFTRSPKLRPPEYLPTRGQIWCERSWDSLEAVLSALKQARSVCCWIGFYEKHTYSDLHFILPMG